MTNPKRLTDEELVNGLELLMLRLKDAYINDSQVDILSQSAERIKTISKSEGT